MEHDLTFTTAQYDAVLYALVITGFALLAGFVHSVTTRGDVGARYRPAITISALIQLVAFVSFIALTLSWIFGYDEQGSVYVPNPGFEFNNGLRYMDWSVSVPMLTMELVAISTLAGAAAQRARAILVPSAFLMVATGFLGEDVFGDRGENDGQLWLWGAISTVFFVIAYGTILKICAQSARELPDDVGRTVRNIGFVFALTWGIYPLGYLVQIFFDSSPGWGVARQVGFSLGTIAAKVGFGVLTHKVATMRTAYDLSVGEQSHDSDVWMSSVKLASARPALGVHLAEHSDLVRDTLPPYPGDLTGKVTSGAARPGRAAHDDGASPSGRGSRRA